MNDDVKEKLLNTIWYYLAHKIISWDEILEYLRDDFENDLLIRVKSEIIDDELKKCVVQTQNPKTKLWVKYYEKSGIIIDYSKDAIPFDNVLIR